MKALLILLAIAATSYATPLNSNSPNAVRIATNDSLGEATNWHYSYPFVSASKQIVIWTGSGTETLTLGTGFDYTPGHWLDDIEDGTWVYGSFHVGVTPEIQGALDEKMSVTAANAAIAAMESDIENIETTPGPAGPTGATGAKGDKGDKGDTGSQGPQGAKGDTGLTGATGSAGTNGTNGTNGATGAQGPKGDTGAAGADAVLTFSTTGTGAATYNGTTKALNIPTPPAIQRVRVQTDSSGNYTWTYPSAYPSGVVPVISCLTESASSTVPQGVQIVGVPTNTSCTFKVINLPSTSVLSVVVLGAPAGAQAYLHLTAIAP